MGTVGGLLGLNGGAGGSGFASPSAANIQTPTTVAQANQVYGENQNAINQQQQFVNAVNAANGVGNQSAVFNQLQGVANGSGPNPAQAQLAQATGANVANQAALMAGQRGSAANVGLMARQAAQQGAATQQQAAGQAATLQANQSLNALNSMGSLATNQANQQANAVQGLNSATANDQSTVLGGIASQNNANVGMQSNINSANAGLAGSTMGMAGSLLGGAASGAAAGLMMGAAPAAAAAEGGKVANLPKVMMADGSAPAATTQLQPVAAPQAAPKNAVASFLNNTSANDPNQNLYKGSSGLGKLAGSAISGLFSSSAPKDTSSADSTNVTAALYGAPGTRTAQGMPTDQATYDVYNSLPNAASGTYTDSSPAPAPAPDAMLPALAMSPNMEYARGGQVPALVSPCEQYLPPKDAKAVAKGKKDPLKAGERIPGKPKFPGNDYRNDVVPKKLESGGIVIPNEIMQGPNPHWAAHKFVASIMAKNGQMPKKANK